jgi:cell division protein FtsW
VSAARSGAQPAAAQRRWETDRWLLLVALLLVGAGLVMVLSASQALAYQVYHFALYLFLKQLVLAGLGLVLMFGLARIDYHRLRPYAPALAVVTVTLMLLVLVPGLGVRVNGARRWFSLSALGTFQPSELGKLAFALFMAHWVDKRGRRLASFGDGLVPFTIILAFVLGVLLLQRDLGTAAVTCAIFLSVYFAGGGPKRYLPLLAVVLVLALVAVVYTESYRAQRLETFLNPLRDPLGAGFQSHQALLGLGSGGLTGVGLGHSVQKYFWLPAAHTDFIFAIIGEETGLVGTTAVLSGFVLLAVRGYRAAIRAPDRFGMAVAAAITTWISFQALINMGTVTDTLPITGLPLPFISYGGSALAITMAATGVLLNIASQGQSHSYSRRRIDAALDIGRRDRRPPVTGPRRRPGV